MYKIREKFVDYNGVTREEDFYFNLTEAELTKMQLSEDGGMVSMLQTLISKKDIKEMIRVFELIIDHAYGVKSPDGRKFIKNAEVLDDFRATEAYSQIFTRFATDDNFAAEFVNNIMPVNVRDRSSEYSVDMNNGDIIKKSEEVSTPTA